MSKHNDQKVVKIDDLYWPIYDQKARPYLIRENDLPKNISKYCESTRMCVQAGGNVGYYVKLYAEIFDQVITFEPDDLNFYCMEKNITETNVKKIYGCVGDSNNSVGLRRSKWNCGYIRVNGQGNIPTHRIDDLNLTQCDLIHLDIEGYEYFALLGAMSTIKKYSPVIALESQNHSNNYGHGIEQIFNLLKELDYVKVDQLHMDTVWKRKQ